MHNWYVHALYAIGSPSRRTSNPPCSITDIRPNSKVVKLAGRIFFYSQIKAPVEVETMILFLKHVQSRHTQWRFGASPLQSNSHQPGRFFLMLLNAFNIEILWGALLLECWASTYEIKSPHLAMKLSGGQSYTFSPIGFCCEIKVWRKRAMYIGFNSLKERYT